MQQPAPENPPSSIGNIISNALGGGTPDTRAYPQAPIAPNPNQPDVPMPPANIPSRDIEPGYSAGNGPVPPADIGGQAPSGPKQTTLLDILLGN
jgi:penicillin-binding protein 1A